MLLKVIQIFKAVIFRSYSVNNLECHRHYSAIVNLIDPSAPVKLYPCIRPAQLCFFLNFWDHSNNNKSAVHAYSDSKQLTSADYLK